MLFFSSWHPKSGVQKAGTTALGPVLPPPAVPSSSTPPGTDLPPHLFLEYKCLHLTLTYITHSRGLEHLNDIILLEKVCLCTYVRVQTSYGYFVPVFCCQGMLRIWVFFWDKYCCGYAFFFLWIDIAVHMDIFGEVVGQL